VRARKRWIEAEAECLAVDPADVAALVALAERLSPELTIVGPELPLVNGVGDAFPTPRAAYRCALAASSPVGG